MIPIELAVLRDLLRCGTIAAVFGAVVALGGYFLIRWIF